MNETVAWGAKVSAEFRTRVVEMASRLGTKADYLMAIMAFETGRTFDPAQRNRANPTSGPVGLIQFTEVGAKSIGITKDELAKLTAVEQLAYVEKFLNKKKELGLARLEDLYAAVHWPAAVGKPLNHIMYSKAEGKAGRSYRANSGLDVDRDGHVRLEEAVAKVKELLAEGELHRR